MTVFPLQEKWNFSVRQHHLDLKPGLEDLCGNETDDDDVVDADNNDPLDDEVLGEVFKAVVSDGIICSVDKDKPEV